MTALLAGVLAALAKALVFAGFMALIFALVD